MSVLLWVLLTSFVGFLAAYVWGQAAKYIDPNYKWFLITPLWMVSVFAYRSHGEKICAQAIILFLVMVGLIFLLANGFVEGAGY
ncbi:hypothetical protein [Marinimicrobium locisalis]|uniref:hypothetical protein n=1 Tax=Marinimicrobium locisalis TaxID=546022 RepID=UPI003221D06E